MSCSMTLNCLWPNLLLQVVALQHLQLLVSALISWINVLNATLTSTTRFISRPEVVFLRVLVVAVINS
jgi:hypothetical protein